MTTHPTPDRPTRIAAIAATVLLLGLITAVASGTNWQLFAVVLITMGLVATALLLFGFHAILRHTRRS